MHVFGYKVGAYTLSGSTLTMVDQQATLTSRDNCHPQWNYKKPVPLKSFTYQPHLGRSEIWSRAGSSPPRWKGRGVRERKRQAAARLIIY